MGVQPRQDRVSNGYSSTYTRQGGSGGSGGGGGDLGVIILDGGDENTFATLVGDQVVACCHNKPNIERL